LKKSQINVRKKSPYQRKALNVLALLIMEDKQFILYLHQLQLKKIQVIIIMREVKAKN
jgi:hypothetical protein